MNEKTTNNRFIDITTILSPDVGYLFLGMAYSTILKKINMIYFLLLQQ